MCRSDPERTTSLTCLTLPACQGCSNLATPPANCWPQPNVPPRTSRHRKLPANRSTMDKVLPLRDQISKAMLPSKKRRQEHRHRGSDKQISVFTRRLDLKNRIGAKTPR